MTVRLPKSPTPGLRPVRKKPLTPFIATAAPAPQPRAPAALWSMTYCPKHGAYRIADGCIACKMESKAQ